MRSIMYDCSVMIVAIRQASDHVASFWLASLSRLPWCPVQCVWLCTTAISPSAATPLGMEARPKFAQAASAAAGWTVPEQVSEELNDMRDSFEGTACDKTVRFQIRGGGTDKNT